MTRRWQRLLLAAFLAVSVPVAAASVTSTQTLAPGDSLTVTCSTSLTATYSAQEATLQCASPASSTPTATAIATATPVPATPTPTPRPTSTATSTAAPTPTTTPTASATATPTPAPSPNADCSTITGYGSNASGGSTRVSVSSFAELRAALKSGNHVLLSGSGTWNGGGDALTVPANVTIDGNGSSVVLRDTWLKVRGSNVILRDLRVRTGDEHVAAGDADAISVNGGSTGISNIAITNVEAIWAPDVGGITILNRVSDVTVQCSIIGVGLLRSAHPEAHEDANGHGFAMNIAGQGQGIPERITVSRNLITTSQGRNPRVQGAKAVDFVNNVVYNYDDGPNGNPQGLNIVGNWFRHGPASQAAGLGAPSTHIFRTATSGDYPNPFRDSVYREGNVADGFTPTTDASAGVLRSTPASPLSVTPLPSSGLLAHVLSIVGPHPLDATSLGWIQQATDRTGVYYNGAGEAVPNPTWP